MPLQLPAAARHRRPERAPDGFPFCPDCLETGWRWRQAAQGEAWVGPCHCGRTVDPLPCGWSTSSPPPAPPGMAVEFLDPRPAEPDSDEPHPISVRHPFRLDQTGSSMPHGREPYYPVCGCGWVGVPHDRERRAWDRAWEHARIDWRLVPVQPEPRALHRRPRRRRGEAIPALPAGYRGPIPCHFGLADQHDGCGNGYLADQRDGVVTYHGCRGVIPPEPWRAGTRAGSGEAASVSVAARGEVCVCPCHLAPDQDALPRRCCRCGAVMRPGWPVYQPCRPCVASVGRSPAEIGRPTSNQALSSSMSAGSQGGRGSLL